MVSPSPNNRPDPKPLPSPYVPVAVKAIDTLALEARAGGEYLRENILHLQKGVMTLEELRARPDLLVCGLSIERLPSCLRGGAVLPPNTDYPDERDIIDFLDLSNPDPSEPDPDGIADSKFRVRLSKATELAKVDAATTELRFGLDDYRVRTAIEAIKTSEIQQILLPDSAALDAMREAYQRAHNILPDSPPSSSSQYFKDLMVADESPRHYLRLRGVTEKWIDAALAMANSRHGILVGVDRSFVEALPAARETAAFAEAKIVSAGIPLSEVRAVVTLGPIEEECLDKILSALKG